MKKKLMSHQNIHLICFDWWATFESEQNTILLLIMFDRNRCYIIYFILFYSWYLIPYCLFRQIWRDRITCTWEPIHTSELSKGPKTVLNLGKYLLYLFITFIVWNYNLFMSNYYKMRTSLHIYFWILEWGWNVKKNIKNSCYYPLFLLILLQR